MLSGAIGFQILARRLGVEIGKAQFSHIEGVDDNVDQSRNSLPITFGFEAQATSWLQWRVSIQQSLFGEREVGDATVSARTTTVGAGASLTWGSLQIDGTLQSMNTDAGATSLGADDLMSNLSATYTF